MLRLLKQAIYEAFDGPLVLTAKRANSAVDLMLQFIEDNEVVRLPGCASRGYALQAEIVSCAPRSIIHAISCSWFRERKIAIISERVIVIG